MSVSRVAPASTLNSLLRMSRISSREELLFADALALPPAERGTFLAKACGENVDALAHLVALVAAHEGPESLVSPLVRPADATTEAFAKVEEKPGDVIGRYKLLQKIGEGGCGVVWMAEQEEPVRRRVALKVIKLGMDTKSVVARFEAERQALAMMDHPCIAKVHDAGATETGRPFFVMELVRGIPITKYCDENHLTPNDRLELFIKVCQAIQHAHQKGVIHRDIKPSNILVTVNDGQPTPKVIDFGIAKATQGRLTDATVFTAFEQFIGTPVYMSPEQAEMSSLDIDTRTDVYSLGVLLYELLTGRPPFDARTFAQAGVDQIRKQIREVEPPRPSARLRTLDDEERTTIARLRGTAESQLSIVLRGDLDWIVMRCIEKDRTRRYDTANGLAMDIQRYLRNEPVVARPPSTAYLLQKLIRRHQYGFVAAAAVLTVVGLGAVVSTWLAIRATRAEREQIELREAAQKAQAKEKDLRLASGIQELAARKRAYAADMNLVEQALAEENLGRARMLMGRYRPNPGERDFRGWEWRYLWQSCRNDALTLLCQKPTPITSLAVSADGRWLAIATAERGGLSVMNLQTRIETQVTVPGNDVSNVAFSPREPLLAVSVDNAAQGGPRKFSIVLWNAATAREVRRLGVDSLSTGLFFSEDGQTVVSVGTRSPEGVTRWRVADGTRLAAYPSTNRNYMHGHPAAVSRDHRILVQTAAETRAARDTLVRVVNLENGQEQWKANAGDDDVKSIAISPDGQLLGTAQGFDSGPIRLWETASGKEVRRLEGHHSWVTTMVFWPDGKTLASASADQTIRIWDVSQGQLLRTLRGHSLEVWALALLPDSRTLVSGSKNGEVILWDTAIPPKNRGHVVLPGRFAAWQFAADIQSVVTLDREGRIRRWYGEAFEQKGELMEVGRIGPPGRTRFAAGLPLVAVAFEDGSVTVWDWERRAVVSKISSPGQILGPEKFLRGGKTLIVAELGSRGTFQEWDLAAAKATRSWSPLGNVDRISQHALSPDERQWLFLDFHRRDALLDRDSGQVSNPGLKVPRPLGVAFSPDGKLIAASGMGITWLWEAPTFREIAKLGGFMMSAGSPIFSPDGSRLAAFGAGGREAMKLWDVESHEHLVTLVGRGSNLSDAAFSADGSTVGAMDWSGMLNLWRAPSWEEIAADEKVEPVVDRAL
jgi:serine/threonine protein kinase/WD40 repeat protein